MSHELDWWISSYQHIDSCCGGLNDEGKKHLEKMIETRQKDMTDYSENYLNLQKLLRKYHTATLKGDFEKATRIAHDLADETIRLEIASIKQLKNQWLK